MISSLTLFGCLLVLFPQPATSFTVKLLGTDNSFGEKQTKVLNSKWPIPNGGVDAFPDPKENKTIKESVQEMNDDEMSLDSLRHQGDMANAEINDYLVKFGYMEPSPTGLISKEVRIEAIKSFQRFANLNPTGLLDLKTIKMMKKPRCGLLDPVSNANFANFDAKGSRKWDSKKLTYRIMRYSEKLSKEVVKKNVAQAFKMWSDVSQLVFDEVTSGSSDLKLRFSAKNHGDGEPFDGKGGVLGHAFYPQHGEIHLDAVENWTVNTKSGINLLFVLVHEIGHALGLGHSKISDAVMGPFYDGYDPNLKLHSDDIAGIQYLYGKPLAQTPAPTTQALTTEAPTTQAPTTQAPTTQPPTTQATTKVSTTQAPTTDISATQAPTTQVPNTQASTTKAPATDVPTTYASSTEVPTTKVLTTNPNPTTVPSTSNAPMTTVPTTYPTTEETWTYEPMPFDRKFPCPFRFSATITVGNRTYAFSRKWIHEMFPDGTSVRKNLTRTIFEYSPRFIIAAAYNEVNGRTFLFSGRWAYRYTDFKLDSGFPKKMKFFIRNAVVMDGYLIGISFSNIHYLDEDTMGDYVDGQISINEEYPGLSKYFRAVVSYGNGYVYLLYRRRVVLLDTITGIMVEKYCERN